jgi:hypothetical protein
MPLTNQQLTDALSALTTRVNAIDGQNLTDPNLGTITVLSKKINGIQSTLNQSILKMEQLYTDLKTTVTSYINLWIQRFGG